MQNTVLVVIGKKGSGKSTLVAEIVAEHPKSITIDSMAEYDDGYEVVYEEECPDAILAAVRRPRFRLACRCLAAEDNLDLIRLTYASAEDCPGLFLIVEETSLYCSPTSLPDEIAAVVRYGRHRQLDLCFVARRPSELHRDLTANADVLITFRTQEPRDLIYLRTFYGDEALTLQSLPDYHVRVFGDLGKAPKPVLYRLAQQRD